MTDGQPTTRGVPDSRTSGLSRNQSLVRGAGILRALARRPEGASVAELARSVGLPRTTVARLLATLEEIGFADRLGPKWLVGRELTRLGQAADPYRRLVGHARPQLEGLAREAQESALLTMVNAAWDVEVLVQIDPPNLVGLTNWVGRRFAGELHATAAGKLALATLPRDEVRSQLPRHLPAYTASTITDFGKLLDELERVSRLGYAETVDELEVGLTAIGVPLDGPLLTNATGVRSISIQISGVTSRVTKTRRAALLPTIRACRDEIVSRLLASPDYE